MSTFYATLEVSEQATAEEIRRAYRRLVLLTHPDRTPDPAAHERYLAVNAAYDVLSQPERRQLYDAALAIWRRPPAPAPVATSPGRTNRDRHRRPMAQVRRGPTPDPYAVVYARYAPWARRFCLLMLVFCGLLLVDFCWTREYPHEVVQAVERHSLSSRRSGMVTYYTFHTRTPASAATSTMGPLARRWLFAKAPYLAKFGSLPWAGRAGSALIR
ncbi:J domain-containing protein [Hymenobacter sp. 5516J-16]|uniref:J domain-containing protein n=1 Tax=Hymenobacter sp. 5516J-16 TaxID=2932253 RepID=UPI001FD605CE|nr:J domain-containing protein [Hymenobacter sp. 5516J-16]UOQ78667.1 J domain-containing protein [Hymenobacter sp. 5516J-16]